MSAGQHGRLWRAVLVFVLALTQLVTPTRASAAPTPGPALSFQTDLVALAGAGLSAGLSEAGAREQQQAAASGSLYFPETGFLVDEPRFVDYFTRRGQVPTFGFPISRTIRFQGMATQFFQRIVIQLWPDGSVQPLNLLDPGLLSYTRVNGSTFPAVNERLGALAPAPGQPGYAQEVLEFVRRNAPETFNGEPVKFFTTFNSTVSPDAAFGRGGGDPNLLPLINLEIWGVPTSLPAQDPNNNGFIYQRFQRGIMHYDASCKCTQGLLLADYFKAILTGENLPIDLAAQAADSPFLRQYAPDRPTGLRMPTALPGTDLTAAFTRQAAPPAASLAPAVSASSVSTVPSAPSFRTRIRLGDGLAKPIDVLEEAKILEPLQTILDSDTDLAFGPLPDAVHARYSRIGGTTGAGAIRSIVVSTRWQQSDPKAIATLIVHEAKHLSDDVAGIDPRSQEGCFQFEVRAFKAQVLAWETFYGPNGKAQPKDELDAELNTWLAVNKRGAGEIEKRVRQLYAQACSQPGPRSH
ncbi:MAG: hypothetical protein U0893_27020 [Chloroflexota bacterium]